MNNYTGYLVFLSDGSEAGTPGHYAWFIAAKYDDGHIDGQYAVSEAVEAANEEDAVALLPGVEDWADEQIPASVKQTVGVEWSLPLDTERWQAGQPPLYLVGMPVRGPNS